MRPPYFVERTLLDGWMSVRSVEDYPLSIRVFVDTNGDFRITHINLAAPRITSKMWQGMSIARLESAVRQFLSENKITLVS